MAYIARLEIHRYAMFCALDEAGQPLSAMGILAELAVRAISAGTAASAPLTGTIACKACPECANATLIHKYGCEF